MPDVSQVATNCFLDPHWNHHFALSQYFWRSPTTGLERRNGLMPQAVAFHKLMIHTKLESVPFTSWNLEVCHTPPKVTKRYTKRYTPTKMLGEGAKFLPSKWISIPDAESQSQMLNLNPRCWMVWYIYLLEGPPCTMWRPCSFPYFLYFLYLLLETSS